LSKWTVNGDAFLVLDGVDVGQNFGRDEALGGPPNFELLFAELLARHDSGMRHRSREKLPATSFAVALALACGLVTRQRDRGRIGSWDHGGLLLQSWPQASPYASRHRKKSRD
jgi:hypothetical protein